MAVIGLMLFCTYLGIIFGIKDIKITPVPVIIMIYAISISMWIIPVGISYIGLISNGITGKEMVVMFREGINIPKHGICTKCRNVGKLLISKLPKSVLHLN